MGNGIVVARVMSEAILYQCLLRSLLSGVSHCRFCCHSCCKNSLALMVTGEIRPSGSKILDAHLRISRFVANIVSIVVSGLDEAHIASEWVSHHRPRTLTGLLSSITCYVI